MKKKLLRNDLTLYIVIAFGLVILFGISFFVYDPQNFYSAGWGVEPGNETSFLYHENSFFIRFNNETQESLIASLSNENFFVFFNQELDFIISDTPEIEDIDLDFHYNSNIVYIEMQYSSDLGKEDGYFILDEILNVFKEKWYVANLSYDYYEEVQIE